MMRDDGVVISTRNLSDLPEYGPGGEWRDQVWVEERDCKYRWKEGIEHFSAREIVAYENSGRNLPSGKWVELKHMFQMPQVRAVYPKLMVNDLVSVQPMTSLASKTFYLKYLAKKEEDE